VLQGFRSSGCTGLLAALRFVQNVALHGQSADYGSTISVMAWSNVNFFLSRYITTMWFSVTRMYQYPKTSSTAGYVLHINSRVCTRLALACSPRQRWCRTQAYYWASTDGRSMRVRQKESQLIVVCTRSRYVPCKVALRLVVWRCKQERQLNT
jgi:hypothetical protein